MKMLELIFGVIIILPIILGIIFTQGADIEQTAATANFSNEQTQNLAESTGWIVPTILLAVVILAVIGLLKVKRGKGVLGCYTPLWFVAEGVSAIIECLRKTKRNRE